MKHLIVLVTFILGFALLQPSAMAQGDILVYHPNGAVLSIPEESWEVVAQPKGFNTGAFHGSLNNRGKLPGWEGWPLYDGDCTKIGFSPRRCDRQPFFMSLPVAPKVPEKDCRSESELTLGPGDHLPPCDE